MKAPPGFFCILAALLYTAGGCSDEKPFQASRRTWRCMGTVANLTIADSSKAGEALGICTAVTARLERKLSTYDPDSELSKINSNAGRRWVSVSQETAEVLRFSLRYAQLSDGAFDPTVMPLVRLWGFGGGDAPAGPPASERIEEVRDLVGYRHVDVRQKDDSYAVYLDTLGARLDLGGVAKGYAVDRCYEALVSEGIGRFIAGIGGNLRCAGGRSSAEPWHIGIRDPFRRGQTLGWVAMSNGMAVASSGDYERFVTIEGKRYSHIIDPRTGRPARGYAQVTVVAPTAAAADALSTALFVLGADETGRVLQDNQDVCALFVPDSPAGQPLATPEFNRLFRPGPGISKVEIIASGRQER